MSPRAWRCALLALLVGCPSPESEGETGEVGDPTVDADQDGYTADIDCADSDPSRHPGAVELCNGLDDNCDGQLGRNEADADGDGLADCWACDEAGFWSDLWYVEDAAALRSALEERTSGLSTCDYTSARRYMFTRIDKVDGYVEGVYTGLLVQVGSNIPDVNVMNTEHTWPQSEGADLPPAECDIHHLYPTDTDANSARGNLPFGEVTANPDWSDGGSLRGRDASNTQVFEPRDVHKGNVARSMLYFAMVYGYSIPSSRVALFKAWDLADPIDQAERARSLAIAEYQGHANPFAVCPGMAERVY